MAWRELVMWSGDGDGGGGGGGGTRGGRVHAREGGWR